MNPDLKVIGYIQQQINDLQSELEAFQTKPTKASSLRLRKQLLAIKNDVPYYRAELIALDKKGY